MSLTKLLPVILLMMATGVQASTRDEIERLWNPQGMAAQPAQPAADTSARTEKPAPRWFRLSNGRQVNLADWKVVLFMQGHCPYCHQFDPVLKQLAQQYGFSVFPYTTLFRSFGTYQVLDAWIARVSREEREALEARQQAMMAEQQEGGHVSH